MADSTQFMYRVVPLHPKRIGPKIKPRGIIWHYTAMTERSELALAKVWAATRGKGNGATAIIRRNGEIIQLCDFYRNSNHAGGPTTGRVYFSDRGERPGVTVGHHPNSVCIGIELSSIGRVRRDSSGWRAAYTGADRIEVTEAELAYLKTDKDLGTGSKSTNWGWIGYTDEQYLGARKIVEMARAEGMKDESVLVVRKKIDGKDYGVVETGALRLEHQDFDPSRKSDPGPLWHARRVVDIVEAEWKP